MKMSSLCKKGRGRAPVKGPLLDPKHRFKKGKKERDKEKERKKKEWMEGRKEEKIENKK